MIPMLQFPRHFKNKPPTEIRGHLRAWLGSTLRATGPVFTLVIAAALATGVYLGVQSRNEGTAEQAVGRPLPPLPAQVMTVKQVAAFHVTERFNGRIEARRRTALAFDQGGRVVEILFEEGDAVEEGVVVARLDDHSLKAERDRIIARRDGIDAQIELAKLNLDRVSSLTERGVASNQVSDDARINLQQLRASRREVDASLAAIELELVKTELIAPFAGRVAERQINQGAVVGAGTPVLTLLQTTSPILRVGLPENRADMLEPGQAVDLRYRGEKVEANVLSILPDLDLVTQSVPVRIEFTPPEGKTLQFGDTAELLLETAIPGPGYILPLAALAEGRRGLWTIYAVADDGRVGIEALEIIAVSGDDAFVGGSLHEGQQIIDAGRHRISPGQIVEPVARDGGAGGT